MDKLLERAILGDELNLNPEPTLVFSTLESVRSRLANGEQLTADDRELFIPIIEFRVADLKPFLKHGPPRRSRGLHGCAVTVSANFMSPEIRVGRESYFARVGGGAMDASITGRINEEAARLMQLTDRKEADRISILKMALDRRRIRCRASSLADS